MLIVAALKKLRHSRFFLIGISCTLFFAFLLGLRIWGLYTLVHEKDRIEAELLVIHRNSRRAYRLDQDLDMATLMAKDIDSRLIDVSRQAYNLRIIYALEKLSQVVIQDANQVQLRAFSLPKPLDKEPLPEDASESEDEALEDISDKPDGYRIASFSVQLEGSFKSLINFLYRLRTEGPFTRVTALDIWVPEEPKGPGMLQAEFMIEILGEEAP
jgi:hypothetical protein